jgi:predicted anti-sigma-YlaC factor YlaD
VTHTDREAAPSVGEPQASQAERPAALAEHAAVRDRLSDELEGSLSSSEQEFIRRHLDACPSCRAFRRTLRKVIELSEQLPRSRLSASARQRLAEQRKVPANRS